MTGEFVVITEDGHVLTINGDYSPEVDDARIFNTLELARANRFEGQRVIFKHQIRNHQKCACCRG